MNTRETPIKFSSAAILLYAAYEPKAFQDGSIKLHNRLVDAGVQSQLLELPHVSQKKSF